MTTSGIFTYQLTRDELITASLRKLGVLAIGQAPSSEDISNAAVALNSLVALLRAKGVPLWARKEYTWTPTTDTYTIGTGYTLNTPYPLRVLQAYRTEASSTKIPIEIKALEDFNKLPITASGNSPIILHYSPAVNYGTLKLWPTPSSTNTAQITIVYQRPFEYFTSATDTMGFPEEMYLPITYKLAVLLAPEWGIPLADRNILRAEANEYMEDALSMEGEDGSFFITPDRIR